MDVIFFLFLNFKNQVTPKLFKNFTHLKLRKVLAPFGLTI